jgi:orotidine-5'-phosphate decarboxylase
MALTPDGTASMSKDSKRGVPERVADRLIVALDVPTVREARELVAKLDGVASFFKLGPWLLCAEGLDGFLDELIAKRGKRVFWDCKLYDIGETVKQGVARAAERGISLITVHGDEAIMRAAVEGRGTSSLMVFAITVLTSLHDDGLRQLGYIAALDELIRLRVRNAVACGCDGIVASAQDNPDEIRRLAGSDSLLIATPGIRPAGTALHDHRRSGTPGSAIASGADYLVVGRPITQHEDPAAQAMRIIEEMQAAGGGGE